MRNDFKDAEITNSVRVGGVLNGRTIASIQTPFWLSEADFIRLKGGPPKTASLAGLIVGGVVGFGIGLIPKLTPFFIGQPMQVNFSEVVTVLVGGGVAGIIYIAGLVLPNERSEVMKKISTHFVGAKPSIKILGDD